MAGVNNPVSSPRAESVLPAAAPPQPPAPTDIAATSHGFYPPLDPAVLRRSLIISGSASALGAMFFSVIQGAVFSFFVEDLGLKERLPFLMALWCVASVGTLAGSWIQAKWNCRKSLFMLCAGGSRLVWLAIGLIPLLWPELARRGNALGWLAGLNLLFYFVHALGHPAWVSWMADLVPPEMEGTYWSWRQVGCSVSSALSRLCFGYYLGSQITASGHDMRAYAIIFCLAAALGVMDILMFLWVEHRRPRVRAAQMGIVSEFARRMTHTGFRRLCWVYLLWGCSNCLIGPTCYFLMREHVGMGVREIATVEVLSLIAFTVFSLLWGRFSDHHGHRGSLVLCLIIHGLCPVFYFFAGRGQDYLIALPAVIGSIGFCGINLYSMPMLIHFTKGKGGGREVAFAAFSVLNGVAHFALLLFMDQALYDWLGKALGYKGHSVPVYYAIMALVIALRMWAVALAWILPQEQDDTPPGTVIMQVVRTNPLRATVSFVRFAIGQQQWEGGVGEMTVAPGDEAEQSERRDVASAQGKG